MKTNYPDWKDYEKQIHKLLITEFPDSIIKFNEILIGKSDIKRQLDISIRLNDRSKSLGIVECKYFNKKVSIGVVDALIGKMDDINANFGLIFTNFGFTKGAEKRVLQSKVSVRCVEYDFLKDFNFVESNDLEEVFMQETMYIDIYCKKCRKLSLYAVKVVRGFGDYDEDIICPECKLPLLNTRTDGGYKVIKRFEKQGLSKQERELCIVNHLENTRKDWDKKFSHLWFAYRQFPSDKLCCICNKSFGTYMANTAVEYKGFRICQECFMSSRTLLLDYDKIT